MNQTILTLIQEINKVLGFYLDKLKIKSPLMYAALQVLSASSIVIIASDDINLGSSESYIISFLVGLSSLMNPRTSQMAQQYQNDNIIQLRGSNDSIESVNIDESECEG